VVTSFPITNPPLRSINFSIELRERHDSGVAGDVSRHKFSIRMRFRNKLCIHVLLLLFYFYRAVHNINRKGSKPLGKVKSKQTVKCTASKLHEKGVILDIDGISTSQYKHVSFEIAATDQNGIFSIKGKFMGIPTDEMELDIQYLLQLQYDGCSIMNLFDRANINVNLLLFFLNSKFYCKKK